MIPLKSLRVEGAAGLSGETQDRTHLGATLPSDDSGQDRAVPSLDEERRQVGDVLLSLGAGAGHRQLWTTTTTTGITKLWTI